MRTTILVVIVLVSEQCFTSPVQAQSTLYVSNLGQTPTGSMPVGSDSSFGQDFRTGTNPNGYVLNSVQLLMDAVSGSPSGFNISIYTGLQPINNLGSLIGPDPAAGGIFTYTASDIVLSPSSYYIIDVTAATPIVDGYYNWSSSLSGSVFGDDGWFILGRGNTFQMAIYATPIPEPATSALFGLGVAFLSFWRLRQLK